MNFFAQKRHLIVVELTHFWIVEQSQVERSTCSQFQNIQHLVHYQAKNIFNVLILPLASEKIRTSKIKKRSTTYGSGSQTGGRDPFKGCKISLKVHQKLLGFFLA